MDSMKPTFVTIFPVAQNVHLIKDVGQVANSMGASGAYEAKLVCYQNSDDYSLLKTEANHLQIEFLERCGRKLFMEKAILNYIKQNAQQIDVIHFFHLTKETIYYVLHYKKCNPKGKAYIKMDVYNEMLEEGIRYSKKPLINWFHKQKEKQFFKKITAISAENPTSVQLLEVKYPLLKKKAFLLTNGINDEFLKKHYPQPKSFSEKENVVLSVGRIGAKDKNYEMLLSSFVKVKNQDWKLILVGPIENGFEEKVATAVRHHPNLEGKIILTGAIEDRIALYEYYNRSKVFCLTSPFESFGIAFVEAMYFGNYIIGTDGMSSFDYISNHSELGIKVAVNDEETLTSQMNELISHPEMMEAVYLKAQQQVAEKFYWSEIIKNLQEALLK